jgi:hypothetical protein
MVSRPIAQPLFTLLIKFQKIGAMVTIAAMNLPYLIGKKSRNLKSNWWLLLYIVAMFILGTLFLAGDIVMSTKAWIDNRNFPGIPAAGLPPGPNGYVLVEFSAPQTMMANAAYSIQSWLADGLMVSIFTYATRRTKCHFPSVISLSHCLRIQLLGHRIPGHSFTRFFQ